MLKLLLSAFKRIVTAVTNPFRMLLVRIQRLFNINIITAKLVRPLTKKVRSLITLRPQKREDYFVVGRWWIYKKLFLTILLALCAAVFIYFTIFAPKLPSASVTAAAVQTNVFFDYDDMALREFTGVANIRAAGGQIVYTGDIAAGVCTGNGTLWDRKGRLEYQGGFEQNQFSGKGTYFYPDGKKKYEGAWAANLYQGEGILYADDGVTQLYTGSFSNGLYEGEGKAYSIGGELLYEGGFSGGVYHGSGTSYYPGGTVRYRGEFLKGQPQGKGELYSEAGKLLYTGDVYAGQINYRALVNYNYAQVREAFAETPRVFYTDTDSAFVFEQAGVTVTVDCRVKVDTWKRPARENQAPNYYMPGEFGSSGDGSGTAGYTPGGSPPPVPTDPEAVSEAQNAPDSSGFADEFPEEIHPVPEFGEELPLETPTPSVQGVAALVRPVKPWAVLLGPAPLGGAPLARQIDWYVAADETGAYTPPGSSSSGPSGSETVVSESGTEAVPPQAAAGGGPVAVSSVPDTPARLYPDFVERDQKLYFEIDRDVWRSEDEMETDKIRVKKVTVFSGELPKVPDGAVEYPDDAPPGLEDCVAIDFLRQQLPTAFSQIVFEADRQNRLFVRLWNINFAQRINRKTYLLENLTYRYAYQEAREEPPLYFSVER